MSKKSIAVLVSGGGTNLQALIDAQNRREINGGEIGMVVSSSPEAYALERAKQANIPGYILPRKNWPSNQAYTRALVSLLQEMGADMVVLAGFMTILTEEIVQAYPNKILNVHPALIPSFCGKGAYGLDYGVKVTGATVHLVTAEPDGGPIVLQKAIDILPWDTPESLQRRVMEECEWKLLPKAVDLLCRDNLKVEGRTVRIIGGRVIV